MRGRALLALGLCALAVAGSWIVPGLVGKGFGKSIPSTAARSLRDAGVSRYSTAG